MITIDINPDFFNSLLNKYPSTIACIYITDTSSIIVSSNELSSINTISETAKYILQIKRSSIIENIDFVNDNSNKDWIIYGTPISYDDKLIGTIIVTSLSNKASYIGNTIKLAVETSLEYEKYIHNTSNRSTTLENIAKNLLNNDVDIEKVTLMMNTMELDTTLLRSVICIKLMYYQNTYFNINLNLGYQSSIERIKNELIKTIKSNPYLNAQDIVYVYSHDTIVILKSFIPVKNISRIYMALDKICSSINESFTIYTSLHFHIAYGNLYSRIDDIKKSFNEANESIVIGEKHNKDKSLYILEDILFDNIFHFLQPQIINKIIEPTIKKLKKKDGTVDAELISCCELFVDNCMNITSTSEKSYLHRNTVRMRVNKLEKITGLNITSNFRDAFILKMIAIYLKHNKCS